MWKGFIALHCKRRTFSRDKQGNILLNKKPCEGGTGAPKLSSEGVPGGD